MTEDIKCMAGYPRFGSTGFIAEQIKEDKVKNTFLHKYFNKLSLLFIVIFRIKRP
ncbi:hypothetical protein UFOVP1491_20 [uncultured Caudovirales phage]|uniref:Uncharacterized protein n=1 Tax=uncultured Caudovirales phage TaxID=2100421 RepID=A0A6J5MLH2_9CAUD|nr:hypothetical protein UFOVP485_101 [uncultured Caudovirales phage]CAB4150920.1 hypothetical protein UFOVP575_53 [uncultured Caudovirales phage]CAB4175011.1 hypothetical protein UFOVP963_107 [uncultured Caudovirales phage]CAB4179618.1 hypothetical protein UFOVP1032_20 [uncultured Caudovirales phage]CAB4185684.1 hypothetical protein UFOVP1125_88 [uncultured Caudovirales phage]